MKNVLILCVLACPRLLFAQEKGIAFENHLSWQQVLQKAKAENKYVFVDCYTSWCGPCKWMDHQVYNNDTVGSLMNKAFVAVKVQMDTTEHDSTSVRKWYSLGNDMGRKYRIRAFPTYLFFSSDGRAVHKVVGAANVRDFLTLTRAAMDPQQQYYTLEDRYLQGTLPHDLMPYLANTAEKIREDSLSMIIASDYIHYLGEVPDKDLWTKDNIEFIGKYGKVIHFPDIVFQRYIHDRIKINSVMGNAGYADRLINLVVYNEDVSLEINSGLKTGSEPKWHILAKTIAGKYGDAFVRGNILNGRVKYYHALRKWDKYTKYFVLELRNNHIENWPYGPGTSWRLNNDAFEVFKYSNRKKELQEALSWIDKALSMNVYVAQELDTKANLLYKLGRKSKAMSFEEKSRNLASNDKDIRENYEKMKNGQPTW